MKKKPFHKVILEEMNEAAKHASSSPIAQSRLECLIGILSKSTLPKGKEKEIAEEIKELIDNFPGACSMTRSVEDSLKKLAKELKN